MVLSDATAPKVMAQAGERMASHKSALLGAIPASLPERTEVLASTHTRRVPRTQGNLKATKDNAKIAGTHVPAPPNHGVRDAVVVQNVPHTTGQQRGN